MAGKPEIIDNLEYALSLVTAERERQDDKFGKQSHHPGNWSLILIEEMGEAASALMAGNREHATFELIQVAAVAVAWLQDHLAEAPWTDDSLPEPLQAVLAFRNASHVERV